MIIDFFFHQNDACDSVTIGDLIKPCFIKIFRYLNNNDLVNLAHTNQFFRKQTEIYFRDTCDSRIAINHIEGEINTVYRVIRTFGTFANTIQLKDLRNERPINAGILALAYAITPNMDIKS